MPRSRLIATLLVVVGSLAAAAFGTPAVSRANGDHAEAVRTPPRPAGVRVDQGRDLPRPNVVLILTDDLDTSLMPYMPNTTRLIRDQGAEFTNFYVEQSSCCPSRASILSGLYAHNHGVIGNVWPEGGYDRWKLTRQDDALPVWLEQRGYRSAMLGKYFNEYPFPVGSGLTHEEKDERRRFVPPGWASWASPVQGNAYAQDHYKLNVDGVVDTGFRTEYLDSWLGRRALSLINGADGFDFAGGGQFLYYASYSPHTPYAYPDELEGTFADERYPRTPDFDEEDVSDKFGLTAQRPRITPEVETQIDETFRKRIRSVQVLDRWVADLVDTLRAQSALENTYIIFTSDNGYHMGNHRREIGKYTHFQNDVLVPFYMRGPGIKPGSVFDDLAGNIDIAPTIAEIAGAPTPSVDGISLLARVQGGAPLERRFFLLGRALTEVNRTAAVGGLAEPPDSEAETTRSSLLNDFTAVTNGRYKLVRYTHLPHEELYDLNRDPYELNNLLAAGEASYQAMSARGQGAVDTLRKALDRLLVCSGKTCRR